MNLSPVKKTSISDQVCEQLKTNLIDGTWRPGEKIPSENDLASAFGVSRVTARQALSRLSTLGLIETRLGEGSFVREIKPGDFLQDMIPNVYLNYELSHDSIREVLEFRLLYEVEVAGLAAQRINDAQILQLEQSYEKMKKFALQSLENYTEEDLSFHSMLAQATGNSLVIQLSGIMNDLLRVTINKLTSNIGTDNGLHYHHKLIRACRSHDPQAAKSVMLEHLQQTLSDFQKTEN